MTRLDCKNGEMSMKPASGMLTEKVALLCPFLKGRVQLAVMRYSRLRSLRVLPFIILGFLPTTNGRAEDWRPTQNVELVAGSSPGGALDRTARSVQGALQSLKLVDSPVIVVNKPGAGSSIAWTYVNRHQGDGHYLTITIPGLLTNKITGTSSLSYTDMTPLATLSSEFVIFAVHSGSKIRDGKELVDVLRKSPNSLNIGIATALGGASHIAVARAMKAAGVDIQKLNFIVYKSSSLAVTALLGGKDLDLVAASAGNFLPVLQSGKIRTVAITSPTRMPGVLSKIPTWKEQGVNSVFASWRGVAGPGQMTARQIGFWDQAFKKMVETSEWQQSLERNYEQGDYMDSTKTKAFLRQQDQELHQILKELKLSKE